MNAPGYFSSALNKSNRALIMPMRESLKDVDFDTIVGTGLSGTVFVSRVSPILKKKFAIVRKPDDRSTHSSRKIEGSVGKKWLFADDLIDSGKTLKRVLGLMQEEHPKSVFVGAYLYENIDKFKDQDALADLCGSWIWNYIGMGPKLGPKTYEETILTTWNPILREPIGGWATQCLKQGLDYSEVRGWLKKQAYPTYLSPDDFSKIMID